MSSKMNLLMVLMISNLLIVTSAFNSQLHQAFKEAGEKEFQKAFNIENDVYFSENSRIFYKYYFENKTISEKMDSFHLFSKESDEVQIPTVEAFVSFSGFCLKSPLCTDDSWNELEKIAIIYRMIFRPLSKGLFLAEQYNIDGNRKFKLLTNEIISKNVVEKLRKLNFIILGENDANSFLSIGQKTFFTNPQRPMNISCRPLGSLFIPSRAEMLILATDAYQCGFGSRTSFQKSYLLRRKFQTSGNWSEIQLSEFGLKSRGGLIGLIRIGEDVHLVGGDTQLFDVVWDDQDEISIKKSKKSKLFRDTDAPRREQLLIKLMQTIANGEEP